MKKRGEGLGLRAEGLLVLLLALSAFPAHAAVFSPEKFTLSNGMQVVVVTNRLSDAVAQMVWVKAGAVDDPQGKSGIAHYLEHMMFKQTDKLDSGEYSTQIAALGGQDNAFTSADSTAYHVTVSAEHLGLVMQMEAERMRYLKIDGAEAKTERDVILSERQQRTENNPVGLFYEKLNAAFWGDHPYGRPVIGWQKEIAALTLSDVKDFYSRHYAPDNAILVISGNVNVKDVLRLAAGTFGRLEKSAHKNVVSLRQEIALPLEQPIIMRDARVKQPFWTKRILAPSYHHNLKEALALEVLCEILTGGEVGLLHRHFVMDKETASGIDVSYDATQRGPATFSLIASPSSKTDIFALSKDVEKYLVALSKKGVSVSSVQAAKKRLLDAAIFARDRLMAPAQILGSTLAVGLKIDDAENWPERISAVTQLQVNAALRHLLSEQHTLSGMLLPEGKEGE